MTSTRPKPLKVSVVLRLNRLGDDPVAEAKRLTGRKAYLTLFDADRTEGPMPEMSLTIRVTAAARAEVVRQQLEGLREKFFVMGAPEIIRPGDVRY